MVSFKFCSTAFLALSRGLGSAGTSASSALAGGATLAGIARTGRIRAGTAVLAALKTLAQCSTIAVLCRRKRERERGN